MKFTTALFRNLEIVFVGIRYFWQHDTLAPSSNCFPRQQTPGEATHTAGDSSEQCKRVG